MNPDDLNGYVRPFLAIFFGGTLCLAFLIQVVNAIIRGGGIDLKDAFIGMAGLVLGWYFGKREAEADARQTRAVVQAVQQAQGGNTP